MPRRPKAHQARVKNLSKAKGAKGLPKNAISCTLDPIPASPSLPRANNLPLIDSEAHTEPSGYCGNISGTEAGPEIEEIGGGEEMGEEEVQRFAATLQAAFDVAHQAKKEALEHKPKRPCHYTGNSARTKRFYAAKRRKLAKNGQIFINQYFTDARDETATEDRSGSGNGSKYTEDDDDEVEEVEDEVEEHLDRIFKEKRAEASRTSFPTRILLIFDPGSPKNHN